jgi:hypothetical protein
VIDTFVSVTALFYCPKAENICTPVADNVRCAFRRKYKFKIMIKNNPPPQYAGIGQIAAAYKAGFNSPES